MKKTIITVVGKDSVGIIAKVCTYLAGNGVDIEKSSKAFSEITDDFDALGEKIGCTIKMQREEIFDKMHRL